MKRLYVLPLLSLLFFVGCNNDGDDLEVATSLKLDSTVTIEMSKYASSTEIWFETNSDWTASIVSSEGGFDIEPKSGQYGNNNKVTLYVEENDLYEVRTATVTIEANGVRQSVKIEQAQGTEIAKLSDSEIFFEAEGGDITLDLESNIAYEIVIGDEEATWLSIPSTKAYGIESITLSAEPNDEGVIRNTLVYVTALSDQSLRDSIYVYQKGDNVLDLSETSLEVSSSGGKAYAMFDATEGATYGVNYMESSDSYWISWKIGDISDEEKMVELTISSNTTGLSRRSILSVWRSIDVLVEGTEDTYVTETVTQDIIVIQDANLLLTSDKSIQSDKDEYVDASGLGGRVSFPLSSNVDYIVTIPTSASEWMSEYSGEELVSDSVQLVLTENTTGAIRQATIMVEALDYDDLYFEVVIKQNVPFVLEAVSEQTSFFCPARETTEIEITVKYYADMTPDSPTISGGSWVNMTGNAEPGENDMEYKYTFVVDPFDSEGDYSRSCTISLTRFGETDALEYTVSQDYILESTYGGSLSSLLTSTYGSTYSDVITVLKVNGSLNNADLETLAAMNVLNNLDISDATIVGDIKIDSEGNTSSGNAIPYRWLRGNSVLETLLLPADLEVIGESSFENCTGLMGSLEIPYPVTSIGAYAFKGCTNYDGSFTFSDPLLTIGEEAFANCTSLVGDLYFYNYVTEIGERAFYGCTSLNGSIKLSRALTVIKESVFEGCTSLGGGLYIPLSVTEIKPNAFKDCKGLSGELSLYDANYLTTIGESAFEGCEKLIGTLVVPKSVTTLGASAFKSCSSLEGINLYNSGLTKIESQTFAHCTSTSVPSISTEITSIGDFAFYQCTGMSGQLTLHSRLASVGDYAFYGCTSLTGSLSIQQSLVDIGKYAFSYCTSLSGGVGITLSANDDDAKISILKEGVFANSSLTGSFTIPGTVVSIEENAISGTNQTGTLIVPASLQNIAPQESIVASAIEFKWTESVPADVVNILRVIDDRFLSTTLIDPYTITIPAGSTDIYETVLDGYRFTEKSSYE